MKSGIENILGKTITKVIVSEKKEVSHRQVFLIFSDDTYFEFYGKNFSGASNIDLGGIEDVKQFVEKMGTKIINLYEQD